MIKSVFIENFQSHKSTKLEFDPGVNVIIGPSDSGKSAVLRAMLWGITNKPGGDSFCSNWKGNTAVDIELENEVISREKGKENLYIVSPEDAPSIEFKAFGAGVPEEIENLFNVSDINIQRQMDAPFLLSSSAGEVGRILNQAVRLDIIDIALKNIARTKKQEQNLLLNAQSTISSKQEELEKYKWLPLAEGCIAKLESLSRQIQQTTDQILDVSHVVKDINTIDITLEGASAILAYSQKVDDLIVLDKDISAQTDLWNNIDAVRRDIVENEKKLELLSKLIKAEKKVNELVKTQQDYDELDLRYEGLTFATDNIDRVKEEIQMAKENNAKLQKEFELIMPDVCPLCGKGD